MHKPFQCQLEPLCAQYYFEMFIDLYTVRFIESVKRVFIIDLADLHFIPSCRSVLLSIMYWIPLRKSTLNATQLQIAIDTEVPVNT
jgi:hypothetical protein